MKAKCDECNEVFEPIIKTDNINNEIDKSYIECIKCGQQFILFYTDETIRNLQSIIKKAKDINEFEKIRNEIAQRMKLIKDQMEGVSKKIQ